MTSAIAPTVSRMLRNIRYAGANRIGRTTKRKRAGKTRTKVHPREDWTVRYDQHPAIISMDLFDEVQRRLDGAGADARRAARSERPSPFPPGMVRCGACGSVAEFHSNRGVRVFMCRRRHQTRGKEIDCAGSVLVDYVFGKVAAHVARLADLPAKRHAEAFSTSAPSSEIATLEKDIARWQNSEQTFATNMTKTMNPAVIEAYARQFEDAVTKRANAETKLAALRAASPAPRSAESIYDSVVSLRNAFVRGEGNVKAEMLAVVGTVSLDFPRLRRIAAARKVLDNGYPFLSPERVEAKKRAAAIALDEDQWSATEAIEIVYAWGSRAVSPATLLDAATTIAAKIAEDRHAG